MPRLSHARWWALDYAWAGLTTVSMIAAPSSADVYRNPSGAPVVVIPGLLERWQYARVLIEALHDAGCDVHVLESLGGNVGSVSAGATRLIELVGLRGLSDVVVVGHSKGGLIAELAMARDRERRIRHVIAICTPFSGSSRARFVPGRPFAELHTQAALIAALAPQSGLAGRITTFSVPYDQHVPEGTRLAGARNRSLPAHGHFRAISDPASVAIIVAEVLAQHGTSGAATSAAPLERG